MKQSTKEYEFSYRSELESEGLMFADLENVLGECQASEGVANKIKLCVSEAFSNALTHGNNLDPRKRVNLKISANHGRLRADISDEGSEGLHKTLSRKPARELDEGGRGIDLMQVAATDVMITTEENGGLRVSLTFDLNPYQNETNSLSTITDGEEA